jgi:hypothetical protein
MNRLLCFVTTIGASVAICGAVYFGLLALRWVLWAVVNAIGP